MKNRTLSIIVPCYNEEEVITNFYQQVTKKLNELKEYKYDILFIDDGSKDKTLSIIEKLATNNDNVNFISFSRNFGKEAAMLAGLQYTTSECVIIMDSDLQHPPELMVKMVEMYEQGYDQVIAKRNRTGDSVVKTGFAILYYKLVNKLVDVKMKDGVGDYRLLSRAAINALISLPEANRFSKGLFSWIGFNQTYIEYENQQRVAGDTKWSFKKLLRYGIDGMLSFNTQPLKICMVMGLIFILLSIAYVGFLLVEIILHGIELPGYFTTIAFVSMLGGIQLLSIGIIGEYVGRIYQETKRRPPFIVKKTNMDENSNSKKESKIDEN